MNSNDKNMFLIMGLISLCIIAILEIVFCLRAHKINKLEKNVEQYFKMKDYVKN